MTELAAGVALDVTVLGEVRLIALIAAAQASARFGDALLLRRVAFFRGSGARVAALRAAPCDVPVLFAHLANNGAVLGEMHLVPVGVAALRAVLLAVSDFLAEIATITLALLLRMRRPALSFAPLRTLLGAMVRVAADQANAVRLQVRRLASSLAAMRAVATQVASLGAEFAADGAVDRAVNDVDAGGASILADAGIVTSSANRAGSSRCVRRCVRRGSSRSRSRSQSRNSRWLLAVCSNVSALVAVLANTTSSLMNISIKTISGFATKIPRI